MGARQAQGAPGCTGRFGRACVLARSAHEPDAVHGRLVARSPCDWLDFTVFARTVVRFRPAPANDPLEEKPA